MLYALDSTLFNTCTICLCTVERNYDTIYYSPTAADLRARPKQIWNPLCTRNFFLASFSGVYLSSSNIRVRSRFTLCRRPC